MYSITQSLIEWLDGLGYVASARPNANSVPPFVTVERTGGYVLDLLDHAILSVQTWGATEADAEAMAIDIRNAALLEARPAGVSRIDINAGPYPFYDEETRYPRYQLVLDITCQLIDN